MATLCADLAAETAQLDRLLAPLTPPQWRQPTPADGWTIHDQVTHLAWFDDAAVTALTDADRFHAEAVRGAADPEGITGRVAREYRDMTSADALAWFRQARAALIEQFGATDPSTRVPWYGPEMAAASSVTARIMETWAHGQDVADALGATRQPTPALRQVAHIGVRALPNSFRARERPVPDTPVAVALTAPDGREWAWGDADADDARDVVRGPALDFCLVVTQRRHVDDTELDVRGRVAAEWMSIAQAFAGPPGPGRAPGQFRHG
jgi:uncharacterized protein (TIGR03084 family)